MRELVQDLKAEGIKHTTMEFCQGRVTRWGLAWTYQDYDLSTMGKTCDATKLFNTFYTSFRSET